MWILRINILVLMLGWSWGLETNCRLTPTRDCLRLLIITPILQTQSTILLVALSIKTQYNTIMNHLKELVTHYMEFHMREFDCSDQTEEETFEIVMENVVSMVEDYSYYDYGKEDK